MFNSYTLTLERQRIEILVNGKTCLVNTEGDPEAFRKKYIIALTQTLGTGRTATGRRPAPGDHDRRLRACLALSAPLLSPNGQGRSSPFGSLRPPFGCMSANRLLAQEI